MGKIKPRSNNGAPLTERCGSVRDGQDCQIHLNHTTNRGTLAAPGPTADMVKLMHRRPAPPITILGSIPRPQVS
jgi:hypothetical protein